ncbi:dihydrolipoyl dehydrogenase family protein [Butyrivibrio sp. YAB3001]|uniref:dihydrolipoyl dehydrogenase family protein n=1 Tax=Butyrivibrio sp. YAB3001 TaxID=1520812 RepID=UPI0008F63CEC|nr:NAD(P)/FAD-dependent oxidoreductase [Butyrivibrio sp. YAB3001]SFB94393.1 dihydrolipoamide dehydrogenase [Butyrivibrio sp. YAB3001]
MSEIEKYDLIIIGGGIAGYSAALKASQALSVAVIEAKKIGGTCLNVGCIPTKAYRQLIMEYKNGNSFFKNDTRLFTREKLADVFEEKINCSVSGLHDGLMQALKKNSIDVYQGKAILADDKMVVVKNDSGEEKRLEYQFLLIATGAKPVVPSVFANEYSNVFTTDKAFVKSNLIPKSIVIVGGGIIGVEFASFLADFGATTIIIEREDHILKKSFSVEVSQTVTKILRKKGVKIYTDCEVVGIEEEDDETIVRIQKRTSPIRSDTEEILTDKVLLSIGREPDLDNQLIQGLSVNVRDGAIVIDEYLKTSNPKVYAAGDVCGGIQLAYTAEYQGEMAALNVMSSVMGEGKIHNGKVGMVPSCIYMNPEIASVGVKETDPDKCFAAKYSLKGNGMAIIENSDDGYVKLIFDQHSGELVGAELVCSHAVEMISLCKEWIEMRKTANDISNSIFPHPSLTEAFKEAAILYLKEVGTGEIPS